MHLHMFTIIKTKNMWKVLSTAHRKIQSILETLVIIMDYSWHMIRIVNLSISYSHYRP